MRLNNISIALFIISMLYWFYLLDPFKSKPQTRRYKKLLNDKKTKVINLSISILLLIVGLTQLIIFRQPELGTLLPFTFIMTIFLLNYISLKTSSRDFHLVLRGDMLKTSAFDKFASFIALILPWFIDLIIPMLLFQK